jgi:hypothetical protein
MGQNKVDIGIFESPIMDTLVIKARPNYNLASPNYITNIVFTIRWPDTSAVTALTNIVSTVNSFFTINPQQSATNGGYRYQVYAMVGQKFVTWTAGQEYPILEVRVNVPGGDCTTFEISDDTYTQQTLNGKYYFEVVGSNRTGIRYQPSVSLVSKGGTVSGSEIICLGSSTSVMTLTGHSGSILGWQKKHDAFGWADIASTAGLTQYTATPDSAGTYLYRAKVRRGECDTAYAFPATITVEGYAMWNGSTDTLWNNPMNWNVCGVPTILKDAEVPVVNSGLYPSVVTDGNCKSLLIRSGAVVRLRPAGSLNVGGAVYQVPGSKGEEGEIEITRKE